MNIETMHESQAVAAFSALAQETRLKILRVLVQAGREGLSAGAIAQAVGVSPSNLSFHIGHLERAGLVAARRQQRSIIYACDYPAIEALGRFLLEDCCRGAPGGKC
jgi:DNA-binding transcriptional ArsR family regulator